MNFIAPQIGVILRSFQVGNIGTLLRIQFLSHLRSLSFSAIAFALTSLFQFLFRFKSVLESDLVSLHRVYVGCPNSRMLLLLKLNFLGLCSIIFWYCASLCLTKHFFHIIIFIFNVYLCGSKIWLWVLIFFLSLNTFLPVFFIENVYLTVFNLVFNFVEFGSLAYCVSFVLIVAFKAEITVQSVYVFLFWVLIFLLLNLIIVICKTLSSICRLFEKKLLNLIFHLLEYYPSSIYFNHSFAALVYFFYISLLVFKDLICKNLIFICFSLVFLLMKTLEFFLFLKTEY